MKLKLNVPLFKQKKGDNACGIIVLQMIFAYYGKKLTYEEILSIAGKRHPYFGNWAAEIACIAKDFGFDAEVINYNLDHIYDISFVGLSGKKLISKLKKQKLKIEEKYRPEIEWDLKLIKKGGKLSIRIPKKSEIISWLKQGVPVAIAPKIGPLYGEPPSTKRRKMIDQHFILITGVEGNNFLIADPAPSKWAINKLPIDLVIYAWYRGKAYTLIVKPK